MTSLSTVFKKAPSDLAHPSDFWGKREIREILLVGLGDWKLKNTSFSRKIKNPRLVYYIFRVDYDMFFTYFYANNDDGRDDRLFYALIYCQLVFFSNVISSNSFFFIDWNTSPQLYQQLVCKSMTLFVFRFFSGYYLS